MFFMDKKLYLLLTFLTIFLFFHTGDVSYGQTTATPAATNCIWEICSIDTMKTSRDRAREQANNPEYDKAIQQQLTTIKNTGANYVAIGTPYDAEFLPYLKRWVDLARSTGLHVWFRGNWSSWEGWFEYPKTMTPQEHLEKTSKFIHDNPDLFADGDIFDACPECENAGPWPRVASKAAYNEFIVTQHSNTQQAFDSIGKKVRTDLPSIVGGHAKEVLMQDTLRDLNNVVSIDHYVKDVHNMEMYVNYFKDTFDTKVFVSEFGAPIPDINGEMTEEEQAMFVDSVLANLYAHNDAVVGLNYFTLYDGSTALLNTDESERKVYGVIKKYYSPTIIVGRVTNTLGQPLSDITIQANTDTSTKTDEDGVYALKIPAYSLTLTVTNEKYTSKSATITTAEDNNVITKNFKLRPQQPSYFYKAKEFLKKSHIVKNLGIL